MLRDRATGVPFLTGGPSACNPAALLGGDPDAHPSPWETCCSPARGAQEPGRRRAGLGSAGARPLLRVWPPHLQACAHICAPAWHAVQHAGWPAPGLCPSDPAWVSWAGSGARARPSPGLGSWFLVGDHLAGRGFCQCPGAPVPLTGLELTWLEGAAGVGSQGRDRQVGPGNRGQLRPSPWQSPCQPTVPSPASVSAALRSQRAPCPHGQATYPEPPSGWKTRHK